MLCRNLRDITLLVFIARNSKCFLQIRNSSKKNGRANAIVWNKKVDNLLFGKLLETSKQKLKRLKLENSSKTPIGNQSNLDSESLWAITSTSKIKFLNQISLNKTKNTNEIILNSDDDQQRKCDTKENTRNKSTTKTSSKIESLNRSEENEGNNCNDIDSMGTFKKENKCETNVNNENKSSVKFDSSNQEISYSNLKVNENQDSLLSRIVIDKLVEFPMFEKCKDSDDLIDSSKILSVSAFENKFSINYPSVTKVLSSTMSEESKLVLEEWKNRMIKKLGLQGFEMYQAELLHEGKLFHAAIMNNLIQKPHIISSKIKPSILSLEEVFKNIDNVRAVESYVVHPTLKYKGKIDCVANYRGTLSLIDWKKSSKRKITLGSTYDAPYQVASYIGAINADLKYPFQIKKGVIVVAYTDGHLATVHEIDEKFLQLYWEIWLGRLQEYHLTLMES